MQNAADGTSVASEDRIDLHHVIVSDLMSLIESVRASMELIESAIAREAPLGNQETATNVVVLDDVTPGYAKAAAALNACNASLGAALQSLLDTEVTVPRNRPGADGRHQPAPSCNRSSLRRRTAARCAHALIIESAR